MMFRNLLTLFLWQGAQYLIPLVTLSYLARTLGVEQFGILAIATNLVGYLLILTDWGFSLSSTQQVAQNSQDPGVLRRIFWDTLLAKVLMGAVSFAVLLIATLAIPALRAMAPVLLLASLQVIGNILTVNWFLQGMERMVAFTAASIVGRLLAIPPVFLFVHSPADVGIAAAIQSLAMAITGAISIYYAFRTTPLWPIQSSLGGARQQLREGWHIFLSQGAVSLYAQSNVVILGFISGPSAAGLFNGADRLRRAAQSLTGPISTAFYPRINSLMVEDRDRATRTMLRLLLAQGGITFAVSAVMFVLAEPATRVLLGAEFMSAVPVVEWLSALPFLVGVSNILGIQMMLPFGMKRPFSRILVLSGMLNILLLIPLSYRFGAVGAAMAVVLTEAFVTLLMAITLYRGKTNLFRPSERRA